MGPLAFFREYVESSVALWRERPNLPVLAIGAITQIDVLAEIVALDQAGGTLQRGEAARYRDDLAAREPALGRVRDLHDGHKHGRLSRASAGDISQGQRPYRSAGTGFFSNFSFPGDILGRTSTAVLLDDRKPLEIGELIHEAMAAWDRELGRLGYLP